MQTAAVLLLLCIACATSVQGAAPRLHDGDSEGAERLAFNGEDILPSARRSLQQTAGRATGAYTGPSSTSGDAKVRASGNICYISSSTSAQLDCTEQGTGSYDQQVPACCESTSRTSSNTCSTQDNAGSITCGNVRKYPACCEFRDQPASICTLSPSSTTTINCGYQSPRPAIECCSSSGMCTYDNDVLGTKYGNYVPRKCPSNTVAGCCPA